MNTTIKTTSEKQTDQIRRFAKKNKIHYTITHDNGTYTITLISLSSAETEKFIKAFTKANNLTKVPPKPHASAA